MPAAIFGDRFISRQKPAWHNLGQTFPLDEKLTVTDAMSRAKLDYTVETVRLIADFGTGDPMKNKKRKLIIPKRCAVVRMPTADDDEPVYFGEAKSGFQVLQNMEAAEILDRGLGSRYPVETAGALGQGEKVFVSLRGEDFDVASVDEIKSYYVLELNHRPGIANRILYTPVRVVCQNTLSMATGAAKINLSIPHTGNPQNLLAFGQKVAEQMANAQDETKAIFNAMATTKISLAQLDAILDAAWPEPPVPKQTRLIEGLSEEQLQELLDGPQAKTAKKIVDKVQSHEYWLTRLEAYKSGARELFEKFNDEHPRMANTVWAGYQAVTECSDWRNGGSTVDESVLFGGRADEKKRAYAAAVDVMNVSLN